jgi:hypothetical protein
VQITHWISIAQVVATAFVGIVAGFITWKMQSRQIDIAKGLQEIARGQHETAATKLRLELFERRFKAYEDLLSSMDKLCGYNDNTESVELNYWNLEFIKACMPIKYLFNESVYAYLKNDLNSMFESYCQAWDRYFLADRTQSRNPQHDVDVNDAYMKLMSAYKELEIKVAPYLHVEKEKPLIEQEDQS